MATITETDWPIEQLYDLGFSAQLFKGVARDPNKPNKLTPSQGRIASNWFANPVRGLLSASDSNDMNRLIVHAGDNWRMFDCDTQEAEDWCKEMFPDWAVTKSCSRGRPHYWVRFSGVPPNQMNNALGIEGLDICVQGIEFKDAFTPNMVADMMAQGTTTTEELGLPAGRRKAKQNSSAATRTDISQQDEEMLRNIAPEHWTKRDTWRQIIWSALERYTPEAIGPLLWELSDQGAGGAEGVDEMMAQRPSGCANTWGGIWHLSEQSNREEHNAIITRGRPSALLDAWKDEAMAIAVIDYTGGGIVKTDGEVYVFDEASGFWERDDKEHMLVQRTVMNLLKPILSDAEKAAWAAYQAVDPKQGKADGLLFRVENAQKFQVRAGQYSSIKAVATVVRLSLKDQDVPFNQVRPYYFSYKDVTFDLETGEQVQLEREDYVTVHTGYNYEPATQDQVDELMTLIAQIQPQIEEREAWLSVAAAGMTGALTENFIVESGRGGNGKGLLNELLQAMLGEYSYKGNVAVLQKPLQTDSPCPAVAQLDGRRFHITSEPSEGFKLDLSTVKAMTGDQELNGRMLHSNKTRILNVQTAVLECNDRPKFNGRMDDSAARRIININFPCKYCLREDDPDLLAGLPNVYLADSKYKLPTWRRDHRGVLFELLRQFIVANRRRGVPGKIIVAPRLQAYTDDYVKKSDIGPEWFFEHYEREEGACAFSAKDVYASFTDSDEYREMSKEERRIWGSNAFIDRLARKLPSTDYHKRIQVGGENRRRLITNWRRS
ncbi:hypothetical protein K0U83_21830 [bacterium]|nr:hypothetical protein [bacterium]